jgi:hypothetical protein
MGTAEVVHSIAFSARDFLDDQEAPMLAENILAHVSATSVIKEFLNQWCRRS